MPDAAAKKDEKGPCSVVQPLRLPSGVIIPCHYLRALGPVILHAMLRIASLDSLFIIFHHNMCPARL